MKNLIYCFSLLLFFSCSKDYMNDNTQDNVRLETRLDEDKSVKIGELVSRLLKNSDIYSKLIFDLKKEWGFDYQVLLSDFIYQNRIIAKSKAESEILDELEKLSSGYMKMTIGTTGRSLKQLEEGKLHPIVFIAPESDSAVEIKGINESYHLESFKVENEPNIPFVVIGYCETCNDDGSLKEELQFETLSDRESNITTRDNRTSGDEEYLIYYRAPDLNSIEKWWNLRPEFRFIGVVGSGSAATQAYSILKKPTREAAQDGVWGNISLFPWYFGNPIGANNGPNYYFQAFEENDSGSEQKLTVGISVKFSDTLQIQGTNYQITYKSHDTNLVGRLIDYRESVPKDYFSSDYLHFRLHNK